eukprot:SAG31_NODE_1901_length_6958_cov_5.749526_2_plen_80_part_00
MDLDVDLVGILRSRRLKWLGHVLRMPEEKLIRKIMLRHEALYKKPIFQKKTITTMYAKFKFSTPERSWVEIPVFLLYRI